MDENSKALKCWCCSSFLARFDDDIAPNEIVGGVCINKRKECKPYDKKCDLFTIKSDLLPKTKHPHSVEAYVKRHNLTFKDGSYEEV